MAPRINKQGTYPYILFLLVALLMMGSKTATAEDKPTILPPSLKCKVIPKTGQTKCYEHTDIQNDEVAQVPCNGTGQDGELQKGVTWPNPRFKDNQNGTVTDNLTSLVWLKNANCLNGKKPRAEALNFAKHLYDGYTLPGTTLGDCGLSDGSTTGKWRVPNRFELESLLDLSQDLPSLPAGHPFINVQNSYYWTSSYLAWAVHLGVGWGVDIGHGVVYPLDWVNEKDKSYVWLVRDK